MLDAELLHKMAKGLANVEGISEDKAIKMIRDEYTPNSELHLKIPQLQTPPSNPLDSTIDLFSKGSAELAAAGSQSQASALEMRKIELEERRLEIEQRRYDAEQRRGDASAQERKDALVLQQERLAFEREQARADQKYRGEQLRNDREQARADQKFTQLMAFGKGNSSDEILGIIKTQNDAQMNHFKEMSTIKDTNRNEFEKIKAERDIELSKIKSTTDKKTADAIDTLIEKMDNPRGTGGFLDEYNEEMEKINKFQTNLTAAGLKTLKAQGVDVDALKKAHNIATDSEESTLDKIIGVGKDLYEKTIKPSMGEAAKNGSGSGINAPSGLETAFETPDTEMEDRIRSAQQVQDKSLSLEEQTKLEQENAELIQQYQDALYNKALQYGIPTHGLSIEKLESTINQYETIMNTPFNSVQQTEPIINLKRMASELNINTTHKTVAQVESEVIQAQQRIEQQLDELDESDILPPDEPIPTPPDESTAYPPSIEESGIPTPDEPIPTPPDESTAYPPPIEESGIPNPNEPIPTPPDESTADPSLIEESGIPTPDEPIPTPPDESTAEETIDYKTDTKKPPYSKRSVTAQHSQHSSDIKNTRFLKRFTTSDGKEVKAKTPHSAAMKMAKELDGTAGSPVQIELTDEKGKTHVFDTRMDESKLRGGITKVPRAKKVNK